MSDTRKADELLAHVGVKGMKWGVRKSENGSSGKPRSEVVSVRPLKNGGSLTIVKDPPPALARALAKLSPKLRENLDRSHMFSLKNAAGEDVGQTQLRRDGPDEMNVVWIDVKKSQQGQGYATAAMKGAIEYSKDKGVKKITLEVPRISPDARHIYEKLGFKDKGVYKDSTPDDAWGGLTAMEYTVPQTRLKQADFDENELTDYIVKALDELPSDDETILQMSNHQKADGFLAHYGVAGMKWGKRKKHEESRRDYKKRVRTEKTEHDQKHLSNVINTSLRKGENVLVRTQFPNDHAVTIMTGKQFVEAASKGALLNARTTDVFATLDPKTGKASYNTPTPGYTPSERK